MKKEVKLHEINPYSRKLFVVGDLHGDLKTYERAVDAWKRKKGSDIVFLGDYADRGDYGLEIIESLKELSEENGVIVLKGNHESYYTSGEPHFFPCDLISEVSKKYGNWYSYFNKELKPFFDSLCISAMYRNEILFVHGGISSKIKNIENLRHPTPDIESDILWSDPGDLPGERGNFRGRDVITFGADVTNTVLKNIGASIIIRSHQPNLATNGPYFMHDGKVVTISSTNVYGGRPHYLEIEVEKIPEIMKNPEKILDCTRYIESEE